MFLHQHPTELSAMKWDDIDDAIRSVIKGVDFLGVLLLVAMVVAAIAGIDLFSGLGN
jgi:hypothetical protein